MPKRKQPSQYTDVDNRVIYVLINPKTREFYVNHSTEKGLKDAYRHHHYGLRYKTADSFVKLKQEGQKPCCFVLEKLRTTKVDAYNHVIVWTKIFIENDYINLDKGNIIDYANDLFDANQVLYDSLKNTNIKELCVCKNCEFKNCSIENKPAQPSKSTYSSGRNKQIKLTFTQEEYQQIVNNAKFCGLSVSAFIRNQGLNPHFVDDGLNEAISNHTDELRTLRDAVMRVVYTIYKTGTYDFTDVEYVKEKLNETLESENKFIKDFRKLENKSLKQLLKTVEEIVKQNQTTN